LTALDVRTERPPADVALALGIINPTRLVIVRRRLLAAPDGTPIQLRVRYLAAELAETTAIGQPKPIPDPWPAALATVDFTRTVWPGDSMRLIVSRLMYKVAARLLG
jgi:hypothetical protein